MDPDGNRLQNSCSPRHWGHSTMHECPQCLGLCGCLIVFVAQVEIVNCHTHGFIPRLTAVCKLVVKVNKRMIDVWFVRWYSVYTLHDLISKE